MPRTRPSRLLAALAALLALAACCAEEPASPSQSPLGAVEPPITTIQAATPGNTLPPIAVPTPVLALMPTSTRMPKPPSAVTPKPAHLAFESTPAANPPPLTPIYRPPEQQYLFIEYLIDRVGAGAALPERERGDFASPGYRFDAATGRL